MAHLRKNSGGHLSKTSGGHLEKFAAGAPSPCPSDCTTCSDYTVILSGGTSCDGTYTLTADSPGACSWTSGDGTLIMSCNDGVWTISELFSVSYEAPNTTGCPPETGWAIVETCSDGGSPAITVSES